MRPLWRSGRPPLGRRAVAHVGVGPQLVLARGHSLLVVGPTQVGKTTSLVVPAVRRWRGPLVVTSVKRDVLTATENERAARGPVVVLEPGRDGGLTFDPLEGVRGHREALAVARDLVVGAPSRATAESEFWNALAVKLLGALIAHTVATGGTVFDLVADLESRAYLTGSPRGGEPSVAAALQSFAAHEPRTADAVATTAEAMLTPWQLRQPLGRLATVLEENGTLYLVAPATDQRHHEGLFRGALRRVLADQQRRREAGATSELLLVLDEAATVAPLEDLDQLAATGLGLGITIVSVFQDFAQIEARWGDRAATIVNNHASRLILGGLLDPRVTTYLPELATPKGALPLRRWPPGTGVLVSGQRPLTRVALVRSRTTRPHRDSQSSLVTMPR